MAARDRIAIETCRRLGLLCRAANIDPGPEPEPAGVDWVLDCLESALDEQEALRREMDGDDGFSFPYVNG